MSDMLVIEKISKQYDNRSPVLEDISCRLPQNTSMAIYGASGSGKSTLLQIIGGLLSPTSGLVRIQDQKITAMSEKDLSFFRLRNLGFLFQQHHLIRELSAYENVALPMIIAGMNDTAIKDRVLSTLDSVDMDARKESYPHQLSGGERQRVALARALVMHPALLIADEPTGNLDWKNKELVIRLILATTKRYGASLVVVSHDKELVNQCDISYELIKGCLK